MAKIKARGATELARAEKQFDWSSGPERVQLLLRSDGVVLKKIVGLTGWKVKGKIKPREGESTVAAFRRSVEAVGYTMKGGAN